METLLLNGTDVRNLLTIEECIAAVEGVFRLRALGKTAPPGILGVHAKDGGFHIKAGVLNAGREYFVAKTNANFPHNRKQNGLPTIQGIVVVCDARDGRLLALMDSIEITIIRTGAATAVAAKYLSRQDAKTITICGCGSQGKISLKAVMAVREIAKAYIYDIDAKAASGMRDQMSEELSLDIEVVPDFRRALAISDICVTCTPSTQYIIRKDDVKPGTFIAAVGSDNEEKQELEPALLAASKVIVDSIDQSSKIGELHHALDAGVIRIEDVYAELGQVIAGVKSPVFSKDDIVIFDSTGTALQDVAAAAIVYEKAMQKPSSAKFAFMSLKP